MLENEHNWKMSELKTWKGGLDMSKEKEEKRKKKEKEKNENWMSWKLESAAQSKKKIWMSWKLERVT